MPKIEDVIPPEQIEAAKANVMAIPPDTFRSVEEGMRWAADQIHAAAAEQDPRRRLELLFEMNIRMEQTMSSLSGGSA